MRVVAGQTYWCISCRFCQTTLAYADGGEVARPDLTREPIECYSCQGRTWYDPAEWRQLTARADGVPFGPHGQRRDEPA